MSVERIIRLNKAFVVLLLILSLFLVSCQKKEPLSVNVYFSPGGYIRGKIIDEINNAKKEYRCRNVFV